MSQYQSRVTYENIRSRNLDVDTVTVRKSIRYPTQLIIPTNPITTVSLSNENSGNLIDANTLSTQYMIMIEEDILVGDTWEVYINSELGIVFGNNTGKILFPSGVIYIQLGLIGGYEFVPLHPIPNGSEIVQPGNKARYQVTVTDVTDTTVRIAFHAIFINTL